MQRYKKEVFTIKRIDKMRKPEVGEVLWLVPEDQRWIKPCSVTVVKIGRTYFYANNRRYRLDDWVEDDGKFVNYSRLWESKETYELYKQATDYQLGLPRLMSKLDVKQTIEVYNFVKELLNKE